MEHKVTLNDIAEQAGVHRSTVSLALRNHPRISKPVRDRIQKLASDLDYRVNPLVAALMQERRTGRPAFDSTIAFVTNYPERFGWRPTHHSRPDFYPGAVERAKQLGYNLEHFWLAEPGMTAQRFCDILATRSIHGLIIGRLPPGQCELQLPLGNFSCVALGMTLRNPVLHHVTENHFQTVWRSMRQCVERGYKRIGFVFSGDNDSPRVGDRWISAFLGYQASLPEADRVPFCHQIPPTEREFAEWFETNRPDAILATHSEVVLDWLSHLKVKVPDEVGIVALEAELKTKCAGIYYEPKKIGELAVEMLVGLMHRNERGVPSDQHEILLSGEWHEGWSLPDRKKR
ncbi:LacI family DNA-binding transcriptional regulator [Pelagicoccus sp. NFK12]|uniref:LacI family DNA-binding transcriptional regulator n=1 Tax=Pelagicoccus enzymogenes TaxID=2773457 RepID=A0A927FAP9_9BACT|nr:LacI family DNA-binding transcriptional regulator [Pelagicoccus enzymogenes]MBD5780925.1 LacI family DNA-binding transcriptional regulator [Pelagicoccus enzymogenes]MDQ8199963.1 LacI family DNA-binding transcriptional regulator [Pelagicoccus enzymogenes]